MYSHVWQSFPSTLKRKQLLNKSILNIFKYQGEKKTDLAWTSFEYMSIKVKLYLLVNIYRGTRYLPSYAYV